eukprot:7125149-Alexandrium_andersonii.AAC.1
MLPRRPRHLLLKDLTADPPEPEAEVSPRATIELSAQFVNMRIQASAPATRAPAARARSPKRLLQLQRL